MVKTKGPILSAEAHGALADTLIYATNNKRRSARTYTKPRDPQTPAQLGHRAMIRYIARQWTTLTDPERATWEDPYDEPTVRLYHAFIRFNGARWGHFQAPTREYPATDAPPNPNQGGFAQYPKWHGVGIRIGNCAAPEPWGYAIFISQTSGFPVHVPTCDDVILHNKGGSDVWLRYDLEPGTWYYRQKPFKENGRWGSTGPQRTFTVLG